MLGLFGRKLVFIIYQSIQEVLQLLVLGAIPRPDIFLIGISVCLIDCIYYSTKCDVCQYKM
uniref:Uncharacterized protein n=1 Tax=Siphoviridae sp. ctqzz19 TaxID=2825682 RepID=A0A8S5U2C2_9CAUD|nr:MAG TPA: hypothetical protein [Siphoviridae sp. ctqzz19]